MAEEQVPAIGDMGANGGLAAPIISGPVVEEVRFAVVMYGGIALCVYMSGITNILYNMVISTARDPNTGAFLVERNLTDVQKVLRKAAQLRTACRKKERTDLPDDHAIGQTEVDCKFIIDILSGTSAGGLNNIFLAKALANEQSLDQLTKLWVEEGDIAKLLNDAERSKDLGYVKPENPPQALLNSIRMQQRLLDAFLGMGDTPAGQSRLVDHLDLYITATDLKGVELGIAAKTGTKAVERKNRAVFHLAYDPLGLPTVSGSGSNYRNDFTEAHTPFLSFIGRATSCIVPAFEPIQLNDLVRLHYAKPELRYNPKKDSQRFAYFFPDYKADDFPTRFFGDGGYGDNFPFGYAIDAIKRRTSNVSVDRFLLYVEPDPEVPSEMPNTEPDPEAMPRPTFVDHILAAGSVKTTEKIRDDVNRIEEHSELLERIKYGIDEIRFAKVPDAEKNEAYTNIRDLVAVDDVSDFLWDLMKSPDYPEVEQRQIRWLVRGLRENLNPKDGKGENLFAKCFDYDTLRRRIKHACEEIDGPLLRKKVKNRPLTPDEVAQLVTLRNQFSSLLLVIDRLPRLVKLKILNPDHKTAYMQAQKSVFRLASQWDHQPNGLETVVEEFVAKLATAIPKCNLTPFARQIRELIFGGKFKVSVDYAAQVMKGSDYQAIQAASLALRTEIERQIDALSVAYDSVFPDHFTLRDDFYKYDQKALPLIYGVESIESSWISLCRVSPLDSKSLVENDEEARRKLAGAGLGHFGGFFKDMWRVHDILWGQLDAIENIISQVVKQDCFARRELIFLGQLAVIKNFEQNFEIERIDEIPPESRIGALKATLLKKAVDQFYKQAKLYGPIPGVYAPFESDIVGCVNVALARHGLSAWNADDLTTLTKDKNPTYTKAPVPNNEQISLTGRSLSILDGMLQTTGNSGKIGKVLSTAGRVVVTVAKILTPGSLHGSIYRHWLGLAIFFDATLLACGIFWPAVFGFAIRASAVTAAAAIVMACLDIAVNTKRGIRGALATLSAIILSGALLWLLFSQQGRTLLHEIDRLNELPGNTWFEKIRLFVTSNFGIQWAALSGLTIVVYLTWLRIQKAEKMRESSDTALAVVSTLVLVAIGLGIPGALLARDSIPTWIWYAAIALPTLLVLLILFGVFGRSAKVMSSVDESTKPNDGTP